MGIKYCVFILSHGRPDNVKTYKTLLKCGFKGDYYIVVDNEDDTINEYIKNFGEDKVKVFDKKKMADSIDVDEGNNFDNRRVIVHARNYCFLLAKELGYTYFIELDDDYYEFAYRFIEGKGQKLTKDLGRVFETIFGFYINTNALSICFAQSGDFLGGIDNGKRMYRFSKRKCMNSFFCSTDRPFTFIGSLNEDVNTYTTLGSRGGLFLTIPVFMINQMDTQSQKSGMSDIYKQFGTYVKSFTTVMMNPSSVKIGMIQSNHSRMHHLIKWKNTVPVIINEKYKKQFDSDNLFAIENKLGEW